MKLNPRHKQGEGRKLDIIGSGQVWRKTTVPEELREGADDDFVRVDLNCPFHPDAGRNCALVGSSEPDKFHVFRGAWVCTGCMRFGTWQETETCGYFEGTLAPDEVVLRCISELVERP